MKTTPLETNSPDVQLVVPDIERDAALGVEWLEGELGRATLTSMGVADKDNKPTTLEYERERIRDFIERDDQLILTALADTEIRKSKTRISSSPFSTQMCTCQG